MSNFSFSQWLLDNRKRRDVAQGRQGSKISHTNGNCGGMYGLCSECYADELADLREWASKQAKAHPGEDFIRYWKRIDGPFYDAWSEVAIERCQEANKGAE